MFHKRLLWEFRENRKKVAGMVLTQWIMLLANVFLIGMMGELIAAMVNGGRLQRPLFQLMAAGVGVILIRAGMSYWNSRLSFEASREVKSRLRTMIYGKLMQLGNAYKEQFQTSEIVQLSTEGVEQLEIYFGKYIPQFFYSLLAPITLFFLVGQRSVKTAAVLVICVPLIPISIVAVQKFARKLLAGYWGTYTEMGDSFLECLQGLTTLKIYEADERYGRKMDEEAEKFRKVTMRVLIMQLNSISVMDLVAYAGAAAGILLGIMEYQRSVIDLPQCFFIIMVSAEFFLPLRLLGSFFHIAMNGNAAADKIFRLIDLSPDTTKKDQEQLLEKVQEQKAAMPETPWSGIVKGKGTESSSIIFSQVYFSYGDNQVLTGVNLQAGRGLTALVGESGCGKSTITDLIMGERRPKKGEVRVAGIPVSLTDPVFLRRKITRICHDSYLFAGTVRENLLMGKEDASRQEMFRVLEQVNLLDFVNSKGGLDYRILEKAVNLSGGQKQRLALARALLHDSEIYIFDEASSNVDVESENDILSVIKKLAEHKIVLLISHRLANVTKAQRIYVMKDGKIVQQGTHETLCRQEGHYAALYNKQKDLEQFGREAACNG